MISLENIFDYEDVRNRKKRSNADAKYYKILHVGNGKKLKVKIEVTKKDKERLKGLYILDMTRSWIQPIMILEDTIQA